MLVAEQQPDRLPAHTILAEEEAAAAEMVKEAEVLLEEEAEAEAAARTIKRYRYQPVLYK